MSQETGYTIDELLQICKKAQSRNLSDLQKAADSLFPDKRGAKLYVIDGGGRAFLRNGDYEKPAFTVGSFRLAQVAVMDDGEIIEY